MYEGINIMGIKLDYSHQNLKDAKIMLIGGAGFIGHHLALALRDKDADVMVVDHLQVNNIVSSINFNLYDFFLILFNFSTSIRFEISFNSHSGRHHF